MSLKRLNEFAEALNHLDSEIQTHIINHIKSVMKLAPKGASLSKQRYNAIMTYIFTVIPDSLIQTRVKTDFHRIMKYDPDVPNVNKQQYNKERYNRLKAEGIPTYILTGQRDLYYRRKTQKDI